MLGEGSAGGETRAAVMSTNGSVMREAALVVLAAISLLLAAMVDGVHRPRVLQATPWCLPSHLCWPNLTAWAALNATVGGALSAPGSHAYASASALEYVNWKYEAGHASSPLALPALAVTARSPADVVAVIRFAAAARIRVAVKSTGHTYTGRSTAGGALLVYLHAMRAVAFHDDFDDGCGGGSAAAVSVQPGINFGDLYPLVDARGFVVVGGGGATVGAAGGYVLGGGHSVLSRSLGLGADNVLSFELVVPNGTLLTVSVREDTVCRWHPCVLG